MSEQTAENDARFYLGVGIDQRRCAACAACPTHPCADHRDHEPCTGASDCPSRLHEHGCYADLDPAACNDPDDHARVIPPAVTAEPDNIVRRIVNAWDCCGTCAGGILANHVAVARQKAADERAEEIAQAIEAVNDFRFSKRDAYDDAARIARESVTE